MTWASMVASIGCGLVLLFTSAARAAEPAAAKPQVPAGWTFGLPQGNPASGKAVFTRMECYSCHALRGVPEKPPQGAGGIGPDLTAYAGLPREYLAESIIKAHTVVAAPGYVVKEGQAGMGKYNHFMTIQELIDLVAFLRTGAAGGPS
jgi:mono/diheme cytochrome c family protein